MKLIVCITVLIYLACLSSGYTGPLWPNTFRVKWHEISYDETTVINEHDGAWFYDWENKRSRFDHMEGHNDMFCPGEELSPDKPHDVCQLFFPPTNDMFAYYPNQGTCCRMCAVGSFCSPMKPDWIEDGLYVGVEEIEGRECDVWYKDGSFSGNYWMEDKEGVPCRFADTTPIGDNPTSFDNITFFAESFSTEPIPDSVFEIPEYCFKDCENPFPPGANYAL
jgi:hypothetical protein